MIPLLALLFVFTLLGTVWLARGNHPLAARAIPDGRSLHELPTPSGAGLVVVLALLAADLFVGIFPHANFTVALLLLAAISWADDRRPISPALRLLVHGGAAVLLLAAQLNPAFGWLALTITFLLVLWSINLFNFMDGMDGFAGGMAVIGFGALGWIARAAPTPAPSLTLACFAVSAAFAGFLVWNFPPARIFLGDVGSAPLGFLAAALSLWGVGAHAFDFAVPLLIFAPFWVDASLTLGRRLLRGERVWEAHRTHAYQRLARSGWGHRRTTLAEYALMGLCAVGAGAYARAEAGLRSGILAAAALLFVALVLIVGRLTRKKSDA